MPPPGMPLFGSAPTVKIVPVPLLFSVIVVVVVVELISLFLLEVLDDDVEVLDWLLIVVAVLCAPVTMVSEAALELELATKAVSDEKDLDVTSDMTVSPSTPTSTFLLVASLALLLLSLRLLLSSSRLPLR
jgi:hypothetical protein